MEKPTIQKQIWANCTRYLVASQHGSVQCYNYAGSDLNEASIYGLWVNETERRKGHARQLLTTALKLLSQENFEIVYIEWKQRETPIGVLRFFQSLGFSIFKSNQDQTHHILRKRLTSTYTPKRFHSGN